MGFDPPTAREAGSGVNGCRFLGIPHGYTPGGASHARKHRTSAASALAISAVGAGETESNHVYCRISFESMLFMLHSALFPGARAQRTRFRSADPWLPHAGRSHALHAARRAIRSRPIRLHRHRRGVASDRTGSRDSSRGRDPRSLVDRTVGTPVRQSVRMDGIVVHFPPCLSIRTRLCTQAAFK